MADINKEHIEITDRWIFKIPSLVIMTLVFGVAFYYLEYIWWFGAYSLYGLIVPGVLVLVWELIKHRHFWMAWLPTATVLIGCLFVFDGIDWLSSLCGLLYWLVSYGTCILLILAQSRSAYRHWERRMASEIGDEPITDPVKDAFLEKLFSNE